MKREEEVWWPDSPPAAPLPKIEESSRSFTSAIVWLATLAWPTHPAREDAPPRLGRRGMTNGEFFLWLVGLGGGFMAVAKWREIAAWVRHIF